jgi:uncharacterized lipoprotein YddW (UPF0748 family)
MKYIHLLSLFIFTLVCCSKADDPAAIKPPIQTSTGIKGVWLTNVASSALDSPDNIKESVQICKKSGITDIFMVVWNKGRTLFISETMNKEFGKPIMEQYAGRDPLQEMIAEAHKSGIKVHAWFEYGFAASNSQQGGVILQKYPQWSAKDRLGNLLISSGGFEWMNGIHPQVQDFMKSLILEVVTKYDIDGIQGDDRLPAMPIAGGYDAFTLELYKQENGSQTPPQNEKDAAWINWRTNKLTAFAGNLYAAVKAVKPKMIVSFAPSIYPFGKDNYLQDWPTWLDKGYCDYVIPQLYRYDIDAYTQTLKSQIDYVKKTPDRSKFYGGVLIQSGSWNPTEEYLDAMISANRNNGIKGEVLFFYEGLKKNSVYFQSKYLTK